MSYKKQILRILADVGGQGISVRLLAKHVYNLNCTLFSQPELAQVHRSVQQYLQRNAATRNPLVERTGRRGHYRLNNGSPAVRKLLAQLREERRRRDDDGDQEPTTTLNAINNTQHPSLFD